MNDTISPLTRAARTTASSFLAATFAILAGFAWAAPNDVGTITTFAGSGVRGFSGDGELATQAALNYADAVAFGATGNLYFCDSNNNRVRKVDTQGIITSVVGNGDGTDSGDGGPAIQAGLTPLALAFDKAGNLFISDANNNRIRKVDAQGVISTVAGTGSTAGYSGDGGPATQANLASPYGLGFDAAGNLFFSDGGNRRIRKIDTLGIITTVAGNGTDQASGDGGAATAAQLSFSYQIAFDATGNLFFADYINARIRKIDTQGIVTTIAGTGTVGYAGDGGPATQAQLSYPAAVVTDSAGNLFVSEVGDYHIRKIDTQGIISTIAGNGTYGYSGDGGPAPQAALSTPYGMAFDTSGDLFFGDARNDRVRRVSKAGGGVMTMPTTTTLAVSPNPVNQGQLVTFTATVAASSAGGGTEAIAAQPQAAAPQSGTVHFSEGGATLADVALNGGRAAYSTASLSAGAHTISAAYSGDAIYASSSTSANVTVNAIGPIATPVTVPALPTSGLVFLGAFLAICAAVALRRRQRRH